MWQSYLKVTFRNLVKNKVFVVINVIGLGLALACCIVAFLNWDYNANFDAYHADTEQVYRINYVRITNGQPIKNGNCPMPLGQEIQATIPQIDEIIRYYPIGGSFRVKNEVFRTDIAAVDPAFFEVFNFPILYGSGTAGLQDQKSIIISRQLQEKYFPDSPNPVGELLTFINDSDLIPFQVAGVFEDPPKNSSFSVGAYIQYDNTLDLFEWETNDWSLFNSTFITLKESADVPAIERQLQAYVDIQNKAKEDYKVNEYYLDPFIGMAVRSEKENIWNHWFRSSLPTAAAGAPGIMAFLILLIACFNFTNTSIAIANRRIKEIGIRKVLGSNRKQLIMQFLGENTMLIFISMLAGLILAAFFVPLYSAMWPFLEIKLDLLSNLGLLGFLLLLLLSTALLAGSYPSLYVSSFEPTTILRGKVRFSGTNSLTRILLTLQFAISLLAIISGFVFSQNATFQEEYDMGFDMESIVFAYVNDEQGFTKMKNELAGYSNIKEIAGSRHSISSSWYTDPVKQGESEVDVSIMDVGAGYLSTIGATLLEGRDFVENSQSDAERSVIINEEMARVMGWDNPINQRLIVKDTIALNVIGVVKDIYFEAGLWDPLDPMLIRYSLPQDFRFISVKTAAEDMLAVKTLMDEKWQSIFPNELSTVRFMDQEKANMALVNSNIKGLFIFLGLVAVLLSIIGLFSLVSLNIIKRMKEIGVRKVLGASIPDITLRISREFIVILLLAAVLGSVGGYFLSEMLMGSIWAYHVPLNWLPFVASVGLLFLISSITIGGKVFRAASMNPALTLKDE